MDYIYIAPLSKALYNLCLPFTHSHTNGCHARYQPACQEQLGVRCLAQGHFDTPRVRSNRQPSDCQTRALTSWAISPQKHDNEFRVLTWPLNSPDLNPIEHLRDVLDNQVRSTAAPPCNLQDLKDLLLTSRCQIPQGTFRGLVESMPRQVRAVSMLWLIDAYCMLKHIVFNYDDDCYCYCSLGISWCVLIPKLQ